MDARPSVCLLLYSWPEERYVGLKVFEIQKIIILQCHVEHNENTVISLCKVTNLANCLDIRQDLI